MPLKKNHRICTGSIGKVTGRCPELLRAPGCGTASSFERESDGIERFSTAASEQIHLGKCFQRHGCCAPKEPDYLLI